ncbi:MAG: gamma-glutamyl-gamma-aminobutyrate hydrolase family protein [Alphaproteobacteria bacterium]
MNKYYLELLPEFKAFCISDEVIEECKKQKIIPEIYLPDDAFTLMAVPRPKVDAPTVAFLLGREQGNYSVDWNYARTITKAGLKIKFVTYVKPEEQLQNCHGLILPDGIFSFPEKYYVYAAPDALEFPSIRAKAYVLCIREALRMGMPILGIDSGAQIIAGELGLKLYRNRSFLDGSIQHKSADHRAHEVKLVPDTPLKEMMGQFKLIVNSHHDEIVSTEGNHSELEFYAFAPDGAPEAWGNETKRILCIQWHPEDYVTSGDQMMLRIYLWLTEKAKLFQTAG